MQTGKAKHNNTQGKNNLFKENKAWEWQQTRSRFVYFSKIVIDIYCKLHLTYCQNSDYLMSI